MGADIIEGTLSEVEGDEYLTVARDIILESSGSHFDPMIVNAFMGRLKEIEMV